MNRNKLPYIYCLIFSFCAACAGGNSGPQQQPGAPANTTAANAIDARGDTSATTPKTPPADIVRAEAGQVELKRGGVGEATVKVKIAEGYHVNGNPASKFQIATTLAVEPANGLGAGQPAYPPSVTRKFKFSEDPIAVYEGEVVIKLPLRAEANATAGATALRAKLRVQPCDEEACYPPQNIQTSIPVVVN